MDQMTNDVLMQMEETAETAADRKRRLARERVAKHRALVMQNHARKAKAKKQKKVWNKRAWKVLKLRFAKHPHLKERYLQKKRATDRNRYFQKQQMTAVVIDEQQSAANRQNRQLRMKNNELRQQRKEIEALKRQLSSQQRRTASSAVNGPAESANASTSSSSTVNTTRLLWQTLTLNQQQLSKEMLRHMADDRRGLNVAFREQAGINISRPESHDSRPNRLREAIRDFFTRDDITKISPDKKAVCGGYQVRHRLYNLSVLHIRFVNECGIDCSYSVFCSYVPKYVKKPKWTNWGTCLCGVCVNPLLAFESLKQCGVFRQEVDIDECASSPSAMLELEKQLQDLAETSGAKLITLVQWEKETDKKTNQKYSCKTSRKLQVNEVVSRLLLLLNAFVDHVARYKTQYSAFRQARDSSLVLGDSATIQIDWSENYDIKQAIQEHGSYYRSTRVAINCMHIWTSEGQRSVAGVSDNTDHRAAAAWAALYSVLQQLVRQERTRITIVSDSPSSQYRNATNFYLIASFAKELKLDLTWLFLESGHGKGAADGVGAAVKRLFDQAVAYAPLNSVNDLADLLTAVEDTELTSSVEFVVYTDSQISEIMRKVPRLKSAAGAMKLHQIRASVNGDFIGSDVSGGTERKLTHRLAAKFRLTTAEIPIASEQLEARCSVAPTDSHDSGNLDEPSVKNLSAPIEDDDAAQLANGEGEFESDGDDESFNHAAIEISDYVVSRYYSERYRKYLYYLCRVENRDFADEVYEVTPFYNRDGTFTRGKNTEMIEFSQVVQYVGKAKCGLGGRKRGAEDVEKPRFGDFVFAYALQ